MAEVALNVFWFSSGYSIYDELLANKTLVPLQGTIEGDRHNADGTLHYVTPKGSSSIPKYFLNQSGKYVYKFLSWYDDFIIRK